MSIPFMSERWVRTVAKRWNQTEPLVLELTHFRGTIDYGVDDWPGHDNMTMFIKDGRVIFAGKSDGKARDYVISADLVVWQSVLSGQMSGKMAMLTKRMRFQGRLAVAVRNLSAFDLHFKLMQRIPVIYS